MHQSPDAAAKRRLSRQTLEDGKKLGELAALGDLRLQAAGVEPDAAGRDGER